MKAWALKNDKKYWDDLDKMWASLCYATLCRTRNEAHLLQRWLGGVGDPVRVEIKEIK